jgi:AraC-like DNA-binding protein
MNVSTAVIRAASAELRRLGVPTESALRSAGLDPLTLRDATTRLSVSQERRFIHEAIRLSGCDDLGLRIGNGAPTHALHVVGSLLQTVGTLRKAAELFVRYSPWLSESTHYELVESGSRATMRFAVTADAPVHGRFSAELNFAFMYRIAKRLVGPNERAEVVRFAHSRPANDAMYAVVFDCPIEFDAPRNEIVFDAALLDVECVPADDSLRLLLERRAEELLSTLGAAPLDRRVRQVLGGAQVPAHLSMAAISSRLGIGAKTLQRRLADAGVSLTQLIESEQKRRTFDALSDSSLSIKELAYRVGFSDATTFHRAFKRWTGTTPAEYRRAQRRSDGDPSD